MGVVAVIRLVAMVDGRRCTMLTDNSIGYAERSCRDRFGKRFTGFEAIPAEIRARAKWKQYKGKEVSRQDLEAWLAEQDDEAEIRELFNQMRGG